MHDKANEILDFWFVQCTPEQHFAKDDALDRAIAERFAGLRDEVLQTAAAGWRDDPRHMLAAIVLLDQFSRNIHRGTAAAFAADPLALSIAREMVAKSWDRELSTERRVFAYLPFEHAEDAVAQAESIRLFEALGNAEYLAYAHDHAEVIARFGRFPSRNAALGRQSTTAEREYLSQPDAGW
jgi:uncharacterized protein (DUF924 family)